MADKRRVHYVLSTHWDREWYQSFQNFRYQLVQLLDRVIAGIESGELKGPFQTDGQEIVIEDYLEIRPERRAQVEQLVRDGRFVVGPWYVMPDEFTISGESLVRNLRIGREAVRALGGTPSNAGFLCDMFGHTSQMPQIFAGFGIPGAFIWRGTLEPGRRNLLWTGADGTTLPALRFGLNGYCDYAIKIRKIGRPDPRQDMEQVMEDLDHLFSAESVETEVGPILFLDGGDHQSWDRETYATLQHWMDWNKERLDGVHSSLDAYLAEMVPQQWRISARVEGELREPGLYTTEKDSQWVIPGVLSSRVWIKQANNQCQTMLCHWAEPTSAFAALALGREYPHGFLHAAWRWLIQNHPHDSMDGCSIDQVHRDMRYRFDQSREIANRVTEENLLSLAASIQPAMGDRELRVLVYNPLPHPVDEIVDLDLHIPPDWPTFNEFFGYEPKHAFRIFDARGSEVPYQRLGQANNRARRRVRLEHFSMSYTSDNVHVALRLSIPAMGYTTLSVRAGEEGHPTRHPAVPGIASAEQALENEFLRAAVEPNGTLTITDKRSGQVYSRALTFEDSADIGDGWYNGPAVNDQAFASTACRADVAVVHNGPWMGALRVRTTMNLPEEFDFHTMTRSERLVEMVLDSLVVLRAGQDYLEVTTTVTNPAGDHRLRVLFPSNAPAKTYLADAAFDVVERPIALRADNHLYRELEVETKPQQSWTAVYAGSRGLAVIAEGLLESAVCDQPERPLALTLLRATRRTVQTDGEPDGQLIGKSTFRYWIAPLAAEPDRVRLANLGQAISAGLRCVQMLPPDVALHDSGHALPLEAGLLQLSGPAVLTSACMTASGLEVRLYNPLVTTAQVMLSTPCYPGGKAPWTSYQRVNLESTPLEEPRDFAGKLSLQIEPKKIVTIQLK
jgi:alpha-mannosidase